MTEKTYETASGTIHYWTSDIIPGRKTLVFLPGLTADHHLFDKQFFIHDCSSRFFLRYTFFQNSRSFLKSFSMASISIHPR